jgi:serine/threonine protein kinase
MMALFGGFIEYIQDPDDNETKNSNRLRGIYKSDNMDIDMKSLNYGKFTIGDRNDIHLFINHILPKISFRNEIFGKNAIKDILIIGKGAYGFVAGYRDLVFKFNHVDDSEQIINENTILTHISRIVHRNIARYYGSIYNERINLSDELKILSIDISNSFSTLCIQIFEKINGSVISKMRAQLKNPKLLLLLINDLIDAVNYLYSNKIMHLDINNTSNIIGTEENENIIFKLIDFGKAKIITDDDETSTYTVGKNKLCSSKRDYYDIVLLMAYDLADFLPNPIQLIRYTEEEIKKELHDKQFEIAMICKNILIWCVDNTHISSDASIYEKTHKYVLQ